MRTSNLLWSLEFGSFIIFFFVVGRRRSNGTSVYCTRCVTVCLFNDFVAVRLFEMLEKVDAVDAQSIEKCKTSAALPISFALSVYGRSERPRFAFQCKQITKRAFRWKCGKKSSQRLRLKNRLNIFLFIFASSRSRALCSCDFGSSMCAHNA